MKLIIPMAGHGTRLRPHTFTRSKALYEVAGKPILGHVLDRIKGIDVNEAIFILDEYNKDLEMYLKSNYKFKCSFVLQKERKGVGHAIYETRNAFKKNEDVFVLFVDTLIEADLKNISKGVHDGVIWTKRVEDPSNFGVVFLHEGYISRLIEKPDVPDSNQAIVGMYYFKSSDMLFDSLKHIIKNEIKNKGEYQLTDAMQHMINIGCKLISKDVSVWEDCGSVENMLEANKYLLNKIDIKSKNPNTSVIIKPVFIDVGAEISNSVIGPNVSIGKDCVIDGCIIKNSIIGEESVVRGANLDGSMIGNKSKVSGKGASLNIGDWSSTDI
ncbi:MAG: sugar phosphate nucleotidyltransferase [Candidatus Woesearchaeota archaeon]